MIDLPISNVIPDNLRVRPESGTHTLSDLSRRTRSATSHRSSSRHFRRACIWSQADQEQMLQELFLTSRERFVRIAYRILRNKEDAEDAVQDAFLSACRHYREFEGRSALTTWLTRIVMNAALMVRRKRKDTTVSSVPELSGDDPLGINRIPDVKANPESAHSQAESHEILRALLDKMNPLLREALTMTYYDELSIAEASSALRAPSGTYKARLFRARGLLEKLAEYQARCYAPFLSNALQRGSLGANPPAELARQAEPGSAASQQ